MANNEKNYAREARLKVSANLLQSKEAEEIPQTTAYAFSAGGKLLARQRLSEQGEATLAFEVPDGGTRVRVLVGPEAQDADNDQEVSLIDLMRRGIAERFVRVDAGNLSPELSFEVFPETWKCWLKSICFVRGTLLKRITTGGLQLDLPVCNATVEVYEVDPLFILIPKLPDLEIERIREFILDPPPPIDPRPVDPPWPLPPLDGPVPIPNPLPNRPGPDIGNLSLISARKAESEISFAASSSENDLRLQARLANTAQLRDALMRNPLVVRPILCLLFPRFVTKRLIAKAVTDDCGHFQTFFFRGCNNPDTPDLYFRATRKIFFTDVPIYEPQPIQCHTFWNYKCGTEVTLITTHPLAPACSPCPPVIAPNNWVLVAAVGNHPLSLIRGTGKELKDTTNATNIGLTDTGEPFGGLLRLRVEFDNSLREDLNVKYYRVSWRKGDSGGFTPLNMECHRHYTHEVGDDLVLEVLPLGPKVINGEPNLFEIPPALAPLGQYSFPDLFEDLTSAKFPSNTFSPGINPPEVPTDQSGKYQLKIDLFDASGNLVNISDQNIKYRVPASTDLSGTIETEDAAALGLVTDDDGDGRDSFVMTLHIDNNKCSANIDAPLINGLFAADDCGVMEYSSGDTVTMPYTASHPNGFARYSFSVKRGVAPVVASASGHAGTGASSSIIETVENLLSPACPVAGFAEVLNVAAMATNGWVRLQSYDADEVRAFVLAPEPPKD